MKNKLVDSTVVKLKSIGNEIELDMIKAILEDNDIPYIVKDYGAGGHMRIISGVSPFNTDVMVSKDDLEQAKNLLESISIK